jgi:hypothetical protein
MRRALLGGPTEKLSRPPDEGEAVEEEGSRHTRHGKSPREGGRLQRGLGGAAGVAASLSAHTSCTAFGIAPLTAEHGKNQPCRAAKPLAKRQAERRRSIRDVGYGQAVRGWSARAARRERMTDTMARGAAGSRALLLEASAEEAN